MLSDNHVLYVEDDATSRVVMEMLLKHYSPSLQLTIFENSEDFLHRLAALSPEPGIIFLDIHMQPYSGFEMLDMLREHSRYADAIIIALTASVMSEEVDQLKSCGFNGAIAKPINREVFPELMNRILDGETVWYIN